MAYTTMEGTVEYFNSETLHSVSYDFSWNFDSLEEAKEMAPKIIAQYEEDAYEDGAMMDTFYFEYDFWVPAEQMSYPA